MAELSFTPVEPVEATKEPHPLTPVVQELIKNAPNWAAFDFPNEDEALSTLKALQTAGRELDVAVRKVSVEANGKQVRLTVRIGDRIKRTAKQGDTNAAETPSE